MKITMVGRGIIVTPETEEEKKKGLAPENSSRIREYVESFISELKKEGHKNPTFQRR